MKQLFILFIPKPVNFLLFAITIFIAGCSLEKESGFNRNMQNLTAHYNILFNAKELLRLKQEAYASTFADNFNEILSVYPDTIAQAGTADKDLEAVLLKANNIITLKEQSKYLGDAYLLIGKANFLAGNYFNAVEYFSYVIRSFPKRKDLVIDAGAWKARTLIYLKELPQAKLTLDTAFLNIDEKHKTFEPYAAKLKYDISAQEYEDGEEMAKQAIMHAGDRVQKLRWTFILAQLQELNHKPDEAIRNYSQIARSNAQFELAFNASLNRIRIEESENGVKISRLNRLRALLKDPNNKEFKDQIYYQIGELQMAAKQTDDAIKSYNQSVRGSYTNRTQKGLSYLRLAQISFKVKGDYVKAKKYYDSTLTSLPVNYQGYVAIQKIGSNLQYLSDRLQTVAREDTLQSLARMDEDTRNKVIDKMVRDHINEQQANAKAAAANAAADLTSPGGRTGPGGGSGGKSSFYFYNTASISQGLTDFKTVWGNRKLEDNWRRSIRSSSDITNNTAAATQVIDPDAPLGIQANGRAATNAGSYRKELLNGLPLTPELLQASNIRLYNAYVDIGNFYRDILDDKKEAIADYEFILKRFPNDPNKPAIYYNLYRLYSNLDAARSDYYKNRLLKEFPETAFARVIIDPEYVKKLGDKDVEFINAYNVIFDLYTRRKYQDVVVKVPQLMQQYPASKYSAQLAYLKIISEGHSERGQPFTDSLKQVATRYPGDKLVTPLVNQHLNYIAANMADIMSRPVVLNDDDPDEIPFTLNPADQQQAAYRPALTPGPPGEVKKPVKKPETKIMPPAPAVAVVNPPVTAPAAAPATTAPPAVTASQTAAAIPAPPQGLAEPDAVITSVFATIDTTNYYLVVNVSSGTTNLSSSRFGIGQFNRANYAGKGIRHDLKPVEADNQLIYVGRFYSLADVKAYARRIVPLLPDIMKVPKDKYSFFITTKQNLDKLADKKTLDSYENYYQKNF